MFATIESVSVYPNTAGVLSVDQAVVRLGFGATVYWQLYTAEGLQVQNNTTPMPADVYAQWGADDRFAVEWLAGAAGLTITGSITIDPPWMPAPPEPTPEPTPEPAPAG
mgnify:CR=1 FL=1